MHTRVKQCVYSCEIVTLPEVPRNKCVDMDGLNKLTSEFNEDSAINRPTMDRIKTYTVIKLLSKVLRPMMVMKFNLLRRCFHVHKNLPT